MMEPLKKLRERIDWLDEQIASLLNERMRASDQVGKIKREQQQEVDDPAREETVLEQVEMRIEHPILKENIASIYKEIMQEAKIAQHFYKHQTLPFQRIAIIGSELIGVSIEKALKTKNPALEVSTNELTHAELIILAVPSSEIIPLAKEIKRNATQKHLIMSVENVEAFEELTDENLEFVATNVLMGNETVPKATLFVNKPWALVPHSKNSAQALDQITDFLRYLGAKS